MLALAVTAIAAGAAYSWAPVRLFALVALGRSPVCPLDRALESAVNLRRTIEIKDRILRSSKLVTTDERGFRLWDTPRGRFWIPQGSDYVLPFNLAEQERGIYGRDAVELRPGDVVLDCGANVGVYTRTALDAGARLVVAIEPAAENLECLRRNFAAESAAGRVVIYPKGVWDRDDYLTLHVDPHNSAADSFLIERQGSRGVERVPLTTIDKLVAELKLERVDFIKMDIEGAEPRALAGGRATLARFHPRLAISAYHAPDHPQSVPRAVREAWPEYRMICGPCAEANWGVRPDVLLFH